MSWPVIVGAAIDGIKPHAIQAKGGPFINGTDTYFVLVDQEGSLPFHIVVVKATDTSDPEAWSLPDEGNSPGSGSFIDVYDVFQKGTKLHITYQDNVPAAEAVYYNRFDMALDAWDEVDTTASDVLVATSDTVIHNAQIVVRSDDSIVICFSGDEQSVHGNPFARQYVTVSSDFGQTWSAPVSLRDGDQIDRSSVRMVLGPSDNLHIVFVETTGVQSTARLFQITFSSSDVLQTYRDTGIDGFGTYSQGGQWPCGPGDVYLQGATNVVRFPFKTSGGADKLAILEFDSGADPSTFAASADLDTEEVGDAASSVHCLLTADSDGRAWAVWVDEISFINHLLMAGDDIADTWDGPSAVHGEVITTFTARIAIRSGVEFLGIIATVGADLFYWEVETDFDPQSLDETSQPVGNFTIPAIAT